jgi:hypothetical protein
MRGALLVLLAVAFVSDGCLVVSLQPAYDDRSLTFDEALVGQWENADDGAHATIERGEWRSYRITYSDRSTTQSFQGNLTALGAATYLDLTQLRGEDPGPFLMPVHGVVRIIVKDDRLFASLLDYDRFMKAIAQRTLGVLKAAVDDRRNVVIASPTSELRRWLMMPAIDAFAPPATFTRKP